MTTKNVIIAWSSNVGQPFRKLIKMTAHYKTVTIIPMSHLHISRTPKCKEILNTFIYNICYAIGNVSTKCNKIATWRINNWTTHLHNRKIKYRGSKPAGHFNVTVIWIKITFQTTAIMIQM